MIGDTNKLNSTELNRQESVKLYQRKIQALLPHWFPNSRKKKNCADQLIDVQIDNCPTVPKILSHHPRHPPASCLNNYRLIALRPITMKCFKRLEFSLWTCMPGFLLNFFYLHFHELQTKSLDLSLVAFG